MENWSVDLNRLNSFLKVVERGSITKAASDLYLTQQAVSKQMLKLEDELNLNLFNRSHNSIILTRDGQRLVEEVSPLFQNIMGSITKLQGEMGSLSGVIKIGTSFGSTKKRLVNAICLFKVKYPNVRFEITFDIDYTLENMIMSNKLDMAILCVYRDEKVLLGEPLEEKNYILCCSKSFYSKYGPIKKYSDLLGVPFVEYTKNYSTFGYWLKKNAPSEYKSFIEQTPEIIVENDLAIEEFIGAGFGMGFIEESHFIGQKNAKNLVKLLPKTGSGQVSLDFVIKKKEMKRLIDTEFKKHLFSVWSTSKNTQ